MIYRFSTKCGICHRDTLAQIACLKCGMTLCSEHVTRDEANLPHCPYCAAGRSPEMARLFKILAILGALLLFLLEAAGPQLIKALERLIESLRKRRRGPGSGD